jgi:hypothetical protein
MDNQYRSENLWWLLLITASALAAFFMMFRHIVNRYCGRIASACQGEDIADIPCSWMDTDRFHDGPWNRTQAYSSHSARFYSIFLFRTRTYASVVFL